MGPNGGMAVPEPRAGSRDAVCGCHAGIVLYVSAWDCSFTSRVGDDELASSTCVGEFGTVVVFLAGGGASVGGNAVA